MNEPTQDRARRFDAILRPHFDALYRAAFRLARRREDAEDLVQEVAVRAWPELERLESLDNPRSWLLRVQYRIFVDEFRRRGRSPFVALAAAADPDCVGSDAPGPEALTEAHLCRRRLARVWEILDRPQRALLALHAEGYTPAELAVVTGLSANAVGVRLHRARARLARLLKDEPASDLKLVQMES
jgi:RNA polymerase sigma-70 factor (ECF subfamily)